MRVPRAAAVEVHFEGKLEVQKYWLEMATPFLAQVFSVDPNSYLHEQWVRLYIIWPHAQQFGWLINLTPISMAVSAFPSELNNGNVAIHKFRRGSTWSFVGGEYEHRPLKRHPKPGMYRWINSFSQKVTSAGSQVVRLGIHCVLRKCSEILPLKTF